MTTGAATGLHVAVLGATGSVGRQVCRILARRGHRVLAVARRHAPHVAEHPFVPLDLVAATPCQLADLFRSRRVEVVVNAAGQWGPDERDMRRAHEGLVAQLLRAIALGSGTPRLVQIGSIHEYGTVPAGALIDETTPTNPTNAYARTKLVGSEAVLAATRAGRATGLVLRPANMCGPYPPRETFLAALLERLRAAGGTDECVPISIGTARRDFVDVRDVAEAVVRAAESTATGQAVNLGRGVAVHIEELVDLLIRAVGFPAGRVRKAYGPVASRGGDWTRVDIRRARRLLGWSPRVSLADSIRAMVDAR
ncbi:NAD(P)-dependent oxidoreductase [Micromonospora sp. NPDC049559]|uniref:NAD-dependent epimerase/dehydratase family protein n=1 Tax=Micromonospora sp. NPDC049559 TaxID=3155923 RepID=UPI00342AF362